MSITILGEKAVRTQLTLLAARMPEAMERALRAEAELIRTHSMRLTPVKTGTLKDSHFVTSRQTIDGPEATIGVGGPAAGYAIYVHEVPPPGGPTAGAVSGTARHKAPTQWKFLETAANHAVDSGLLLRLAGRMNASLRKSRGF